MCLIIANAHPLHVLVLGTMATAADVLHRLHLNCLNPSTRLDAFLQFPNATTRAWFHFSSVSPGNYISLGKMELCQTRSHSETEGHSPWSQKGFNMHCVTWGAVSSPILHGGSVAVVRQAEHGRCFRELPLIWRKVCVCVCVCVCAHGCDVSLASCRDN